MDIAFVRSFSRIGGWITAALGVLWPVLTVAAIYLAAPAVGPAMVPGNMFFALAVTGLLLCCAAMFMPYFNFRTPITEGINPHVMVLQALTCIAAMLMTGLYIGSQCRDWYAQFELPPAGMFGLAVMTLGIFAFFAGLLYTRQRAENQRAAAAEANAFDCTTQPDEVSRRERREQQLVYGGAALVQCFGATMVGFHLGATMIL